MIFIFYAVGLFMGGAWMYTHMRSKYHRGCDNFFGECATLIQADRFGPDTVMVAFQRHMPWQVDA